MTRGSGGEQAYCYPSDIPIFPFRVDNCVINLQNNAMVALPV